MSSFSDNVINDLTLQYLTNKDFINQTRKHLQAKTLKVKPKEKNCLLYTSPSPRDLDLSRMPSSA